MKTKLHQKALSLSMLVLSLFCYSQTLIRAHAQNQSIAFEPKTLGEYIHRPLQDFTQKWASYLTPDGTYRTTYNNKVYHLSAVADAKNLLHTLRLTPEGASLDDAINILKLGQDATLPLGAFMGAKFSGTSGGLKRTIDETLQLMQSQDNGLRIVSVFNPKPGVYFVLDWQKNGYHLLLVRNFCPLYVAELTAKIDTDFEAFYQEHFYIANKINMFGMINLYFDAVKNSDNLLFTMNCNADASKTKIKEISIYLNKTDNEQLQRSIDLWTQEAKSFVGLFPDATPEIYATDAFGGIKQTFASLDEASAFVATNKRQDGVIISIEVGMNKANLVINKNNVYYLLQKNEKKASITLGYNLPKDTPLTFELETNSTVMVDWGDGKPQDMGNKSMISGKLLGSKVRIYGEITSFNCESTKAQTLDLSGAPLLEEIYCANNQLDRLSFAHNPNLKMIDCEKNRLTQINVTMLEKLEKLLCSENQLASIDLTKNKKLKRLMATDNRISQLNLANNPLLNILNCSGNSLSQLHLQANELLVQLIAGNNQLESIDLGTCTELERVVLKNNRLATIDLSKNTSLQFMDLSNNQLHEVKLEAMKHLTECILYNNQLTTFDPEKMPSVMRLNLGSNKIASLSVASNPKMRDLYVYSNTFDFNASQALAESIYDRSQESVPGHIYILGTLPERENKIYRETAQLLKKKGWEMYRVAVDADGNLQETLLTATDIEALPLGINTPNNGDPIFLFDGKHLTCNAPMQSLSVYNWAGDWIESLDQPRSSYDLQHLSRGGYLLVITDNNVKSTTLKVVIK